MNTQARLVAATGLASLIMLGTACSDDDTNTGGSGGTGGSGAAAGSGGAGGNGDLDISVCAPDAGPFSLTIDNPYLPMVVGTQTVLEGDDDGATVTVTITVLDETEEIAGVTTRVLEENEQEDGELVEISRNFFVQAPDGTVCYYGEDVDIYDNGAVVSHDGAWRAGEGESLPGILMPGGPMVGMSYPQELAPGVAMDRAEIVSIGEPFATPLATYEDTLRTLESSPIDAGATSDKSYAPGVGLIYDDGVALISRTTL